MWLGAIWVVSFCSILFGWWLRVEIELWNRANRPHEPIDFTHRKLGS
jgi:hypothetical protein